MSTLSPQFTQRGYFWTQWLQMRILKSLVLQYEDADGVYTIWGYDGPEVHVCTIWKGLVPDGVIAGGYSQSQNDTDKTDFETNFKPYGNRPINANPSSLIIASTLKTSGGGANLGVNGAVTPVVFEYFPPNNYDIEITEICMVFEDTTVFAFGNKFVLTGINTLTNGMFLELKAQDQVVSPWQNMKRTRDIMEISSSFSIVTGTTNFLQVHLELPKNLRLSRAGTFAQPDYLRITVRDDLSSIDFAEVHFQGVKV
jgi:hypothetical protein